MSRSFRGRAYDDWGTESNKRKSALNKNAFSERPHRESNLIRRMQKYDPTDEALTEELDSLADR